MLRWRRRVWRLPFEKWALGLPCVRGQMAFDGKTGHRLWTSVALPSYGIERIIASNGLVCVSPCVCGSFACVVSG